MAETKRQPRPFRERMLGSMERWREEAKVESDEHAEAAAQAAIDRLEEADAIDEVRRAHERLDAIRARRNGGE